MSFQEMKKNICRACLDDTVVLNWNSPVYGYYDITYKECFYKYTQLNCPVADPFSPMLCQICLNSLYNIHTFILKALESDNFFKETNFELAKSVNLNDVKCMQPEFESIIVGKLEVAPSLQDNFAFEPTDGEITNKKKCYAESKKLEKKKFKSNFKGCTTLEAKRNRSVNKLSNSFKR